jgi:hypothetical protein
MMGDDVRRYVYGTLVVFVLLLFAWVGFVYVNACGFTVTCLRGQIPVDRTPIPTLVPATLPALERVGGAGEASARCEIAAADLIGAWVAAGSPESQSFPFTDLDGRPCETDFEEVKPLFVEGNLWYPGSLSCVSCHSVEVAISPAQLDLSSYAGIRAGSGRADADSQGEDILGGGDWNKSILYDFISNPRVDVPGHTDAIAGLVISAGVPLPRSKQEAPSTPTPEPSAVP